MKILQRFFLLCAVLVVSGAALAAETGWPSRPVRLVVPFPPGGGNDVFARELAHALQKRLGQTFVVENRGGASGSIGMTSVARSEPDGYTFLVTSNSLVTNKALSDSMPYDIVKDFEPVSLAASLSVALVVTDKVPAKTLPEFIAYIKNHPDKLTYGSTGVGSPAHLTNAYLNMETGMNMLHIPFKGQGQLVTEMLGGRVDAAFLVITSAIQHMKAGTLRGLAVTGDQRSRVAPELPTLDEAGLPSLKIDWWLGVLAPKHTPAAIVDKMSAAIAAISRDPAFAERLEAQGIIPIGSTPQAYAKVLDEDLARWSGAVKRAGITVQ